MVGACLGAGDGEERAPGASLMPTLGTGAGDGAAAVTFIETEGEVSPGLGSVEFRGDEGGSGLGRGCSLLLLYTLIRSCHRDFAKLLQYSEKAPVGSLSTSQVFSEYCENIREMSVRAVTLMVLFCCLRRLLR